MRIFLHLLLIGCVSVCGLAAFAQAPDLAKMDLVEKSVPDGPVAKVCGANITASEFLDLYRGMVAREQAARSGAPVSDADRIGFALQCMGMLIEREILYQEALNRKLEIPQEQIEKAFDIELDQLRKRVSRGKGADVTEDQLLNMASASREAAMAELRKALLIEKIQAALAKEKGITVTDEEVAREFEQNKARLARPAMCHIKQIFVRAPKADTKEADEKRREARKRVETALKRIRAGESFDAVAKTVSDDQFRENGGDLGLRPLGDAPGALPPFLAQAAGALQPNEVSGIVESDFGFHIVQLIEARPGKEPSLDEAKDLVRAKLMSDRAGKAAKEFCRKVMDREGAVQVFLELDKTIATHPNREELQKVFAASHDIGKPGTK